MQPAELRFHCTVKQEQELKKPVSGCERGRGHGGQWVSRKKSWPKTRPTPDPPASGSREGSGAGTLGWGGGES